MRWWLLGASLWLLVVQLVPDAQAGNRPRGPDAEKYRGKRKRERQGFHRAREERPRPMKTRTVPAPYIPVPAGNHGNDPFLKPLKNLQEQHVTYNVIPGKQGQCVYQGLIMYDQAVWSPKPCVTCLCSGGRVVCDEISCPEAPCPFPPTLTGDCCPACIEPVPADIVDSVTLRTQEEIQELLRQEEEDHRVEEERLRRKDENRKKRRKQRKEQEERQRQMIEEKRREEERMRELEEEEERTRQLEAAEERRRQIEEEERRRWEEDDRKRKELAEQEMKERRMQAETLKQEMLALVAEEEEEEVWLRGDVFQMLPKAPDEPEEPGLLPVPIPRPPDVIDHEVEVEASHSVSLPQGCEISDVIVTCENAKLTHFPPLTIPELKSLSLEGNNINTIPAEAFNGIPNLEWINLKKNKLTSAGVHPNAFKRLKMLRRLYLDGNLLDAVPPDLPPTLHELKISENRIRGLDENSFQELSSLVILELEENLLSEGNVNPQAFAPLIQLSYLRLGRNHFRTVPQGLPKSLLELHLDNNLIEEISDTVFNQTSLLNVVSLKHNKLDETRIAPLAWINHRHLESVDLSHNDLYLVPSYLPRSLVHLVLVGNHIERIPGYVFAHMDPGLEYLYLSFNKLDGEGIEPESFFGSYHSMVELCLDHNQLITVPSGIIEMTNLHFLRLNNNRIRSIPDESICDPHHSGDSTLVALRLENNYIDPQKVSPTAFSCVRSSSSVVLKPQNTK
ncbi:extracellular matrix protein 2 isoform X2 [Gouania willdenowi]|uniref:extracellular matrix protein 2 isoform X2 n=1 Tax=Gouania willdenowi TaxID=441366 RepID=UPI0010558664|nr:extracellular matrix protein 2 isoform X2 [Gouania willdenowi]